MKWKKGNDRWRYWVWKEAERGRFETVGYSGFKWFWVAYVTGKIVSFFNWKLEIKVILGNEKKETVHGWHFRKGRLHLEY